jgi:hypothetical protein
VSLVLDALKKLERSREAKDGGVLVVGSVPWEGVGRPRRTRLALSGVTLVVAAALAGAWLARSRPRPGPAPVAPTVASPALPAPSTTQPPAAHLDAPRLGLSAPAAPAPRPSARPVARTPRTPPAHAVGDELRLSAISQRDGRPVALIGDHLVFEGDIFDGVRVVRIGETEVEVEVRGQRRVLKF